jgi:putative peptide zinc metalloprotease protein
MSAPTPGAVPEDILARKIRLRPDIAWSQFSSGEGATWVARDPISLEYFYFSQREHAITKLLDGNRSPLSILSHPVGRSTTRQWLVELVRKLESACLIVPRDTVASGRRLWATSCRHRRSGFWQRLVSPLAIRIKLFDPTWLLQLLAPVARLVFSKAFFGVWLVAVVLAGFSVVLRLLQSPGSLMDSLAGITAERALGLGLIYVCVKSLHELGHALACKKWGAECHEIGVFFLVFMPCLYCDTSDCWKLSSRMKRASIAAAGIYIEIALAAVGAMVWLTTSSESMLHLLAANVMVICSLSTVLVNANPLLRYDGYYALSDLWGVPNLHEQSREASRATTMAWLVGCKVPQGRWDASPGLLSLFAFASWCYRHFVVVMISWAVWTLLKGWGLNLIGATLVVFTLANVVLANYVAGVRWVKELRMAGGVRVLRATMVCVLLLVCVVAFFVKPLPARLQSRAVVTLTNAIPVYSEQAGILVSFEKPGTQIERDSEIARIESADLVLEEIEVRGQAALLEQHVTQLRSRLVDDESAAAELATVIEQLSKATDRLKILEKEVDSLVSYAPSDGILLVGYRMNQHMLTAFPDQQASRPLLSEENTGCYIDRGTLLGWISPPVVNTDKDRFEVTAYVAESDAELLTVGMAVSCRWDCALHRRVTGTVVRISPEPISEIPESLLGDESIPFGASSDGKLTPATPHFEVQLSISNLPNELSHQSLATVHYEIPPRTLFQSVCEFLNKNVRPEL